MKITSSQALISISLFTVIACGGGGGVSSEETARKAYLGLDKAVARSMQLGFDGFSAANSANIPAQSTTGAKSGTLSINGQVDQGASPNKGMRLTLGMSNYSDGDVALDGGASVAITYATPPDGGTAPKLDLSLRSIPNGTFSGTLVGEFEMAGGLSGRVKLDLTMSGEIQDGGTGTVIRKPGTTTVTGTATSGPGVFQVNVSL